MSIVQLLQWQWEGYPTYHRSRANLLIHIVAVPLFLIGTLAFIFAIVTFAPLRALMAVACMGVAMALQGRGHGMEENPPVPFSGPSNAVARIFLEQWITFPRFVVSGGWYAALRAAGKNS